MQVFSIPDCVTGVGVSLLEAVCSIDIFKEWLARTSDSFLEGIVLAESISRVKGLHYPASGIDVMSEQGFLTSLSSTLVSHLPLLLLYVSGVL